MFRAAFGAPPMCAIVRESWAAEEQGVCSIIYHRALGLLKEHN